MIAGRFRLGALALFVALRLTASASFAWKNDDHDRISQAAVARVVAQQGTKLEAPDIQRYGGTIRAWTWGCGPGNGLDTAFGFELSAERVGPNPVERLAHSGSQSTWWRFICNNGGDVDTLYKRLLGSYTSENFLTTTDEQEGAYILLGVMAHVIEDQASFPHAMNYPHTFD